ncbi:MAG: trypsin-like peptidase domain-containing protein [Betaproteobacteria bacterium]|nr:trypsin-like peptidase domain-containing protein [Betaproteobacteria bacterium]
MRCWTLAVAAAFVVTGAATARILSVPPAPAPARPLASKAAARLLLPDTAASRRVTLAAPAADESKRAGAESATSGVNGKAATKRRRLPVGFARALPASERALPLSTLPWQDAGSGLRAARITITSPGARGLRIAIALSHPPSGLVVRFRGSAPAAAVYGPVDAARIVSEGTFWSPLLDGETAVVELAVPRGASLAGATISLPMLSHLSLSTGALKQADPLGDIGASGSCEVDVACIASPLQQQASQAIDATARILLVDHGSSYLCTGTLLNDSATSLTPYFYTANHCIDNDGSDPAASQGQPAAVAQTFETFWRFQTDTCGVDAAANVNFSEAAAGATLLARGVDYDWALVRLNAAPPAGATFSAWNGNGMIAIGTAADGIHHPKGDLKKFSQGAVQPYDTYSDGSSFIAMQWSRGATEPGSSGSGLFTLDASRSYLELRGGLYGGGSSCNTPTGIDDFSRFDVALPLLVQYLTPGAANPAKTTPVVEYYNATLDDYFITASPLEIQVLDTGVLVGWVRTGLRFLAYTDPSVAPAGVQPVCRFYVKPAYGDSHFYSASPAECAAVGQKFAAQWVEESPSVFYILLPNATTGACPAGSKPVYRFLSDSNGLHHRYTTEVDVRDSIIKDGGWIQEGYGVPPNSPVMCAPSS